MTKRDDQLPAASPYFTLNESCSTQKFGLFLKAQSASTPIEKVKSIPRTGSNELPPKEEPPTDKVPLQYADIANYTLAAKKLSTIMETSENTNSTGANTKSSISSSDSDTEVMKGKSITGASILSKSKSALANLSTPAGMAAKEQSRTKLETFDERDKELEDDKVTKANNASGAIPKIPSFQVFEDKTEKIVSPIEPNEVFQNTPNISTAATVPIKEPSFAFQIFEDKTENIEKPNYTVEPQHTLVINETPTKDKTPFVGFQIFEDKTEARITAQSLQTHKLPALPLNESKIDKENRILYSTVQSPTICEPEFSLFKDPSLKISKPEEQDNNSILPSFKFDDTQPVAGTGPLNITQFKPLVSFETSQPRDCDNSPISPAGASNESRQSDGINFEFFATTPKKPGSQQLYAPTHTSSALIRFESIEKNTTESLLKMNVEDSKHISMLAKAPDSSLFAEKERSQSLLPLAQIKQEKSLHINDDRFSFSRPTAPSPVEFKSPKLPIPKTKPIFIEDDQINTLKFNSMLGNVQNSTFISQPTETVLSAQTEVAKPLVKTDSIENITTKVTKLSVSMDENEFMTIFEDQSVGKSYETKLKPVETVKVTEPKQETGLKKACSMSYKSNTDMHDDLGQSIYLGRSNSFPEENWDDSDHKSDSYGDDKYMHSSVNLDETVAVIGHHLNAEVINPFDREFTKALLEKVNIMGFIERQEHCSLRKKIKPMRAGQHLSFADYDFEVMKAIGKGAFGTVFR